MSCLGRITDDQKAIKHLPEHGISLFLRHRTKTIHFIRHAEGFHNQIIKQTGSDTPTIYSTPGSEQYIDAKLTPNGINQCKEARINIADQINPQLVIVSPLTRTLETAHYMFSRRNIPFLVHDICRERYGKYINDKRRPKTQILNEIKPLYKKDTIDYTSYGYMKEDDDLWQFERESDESCEKRGIELLEFLSSRKEDEIAVVTHSSFLRHLFGEFGCNLSQQDRTILQRSTVNAEIRSVTLAAHKSFT